MAQTATLHIKIEPAVAKGLKDVARRRDVTVCELVRRAVNACYQVELVALTDGQRHAVEAYQGGYISLGKLSEVMGLSSLNLRKWFGEHGIDQNTCYRREDVRHV